MMAVLVLITGTVGCTGTLLKENPDLHFEPHGLYGHINGGSELFLEFGFVGLDVYNVAVETETDTEITGEVSEYLDEELDEELAVELYHMADKEAALGIYLAKCGKESPLPGLVVRNTGSAYQITAVAGTIFLQVNNFSGEAANLPQMTKIANEVLASHADDQPLPVWQHLPHTNRVSGTEFMFRGQYALDPIFTFGEGNILQINSPAIGAGARYDNGDGVIYRQLTVVYDNPESAEVALAYLKGHLDSYISVVKSSAAGLVFKDYADKYGIVKTVNNRLDIAINLVKAPSL